MARADREAVLRGVNARFDETGDDDAVIAALGSPTFAAVSVLRGYTPPEYDGDEDEYAEDEYEYTQAPAEQPAAAEPAAEPEPEIEEPEPENAAQAPSNGTTEPAAAPEEQPGEAQAVSEPETEPAEAEPEPEPAAEDEPVNTEDEPVSAETVTIGTETVEVYSEPAKEPESTEGAAEPAAPEEEPEPAGEPEEPEPEPEKEPEPFLPEFPEPEPERPPRKGGRVFLTALLTVVPGIPLAAVFAAVTLALLAVGAALLYAGGVFISFAFLGMNVAADIMLTVGFGLAVAAVGLPIVFFALWFFIRCFIGLYGRAFARADAWCRGEVRE